MLKHRKRMPLDYSLCRMTVTVFRHRDGSRHILEQVHYEYTDERTVTKGRAAKSRSFLLVIPGGFDIEPGDRVLLGRVEADGELQEWNASVPTLGTVSTVKQRYLNGQLCHTEARG